MTHPTTEQSIRERLARAGTIGYGCIGDWSEFSEEGRRQWYRALDAILAELPLILTMEFLAGVRGRFVTETAPDEAMISSIIKATVAHIRDGGK